MKHWILITAAIVLVGGLACDEPDHDGLADATTRARDVIEPTRLDLVESIDPPVAATHELIQLALDGDTLRWVRSTRVDAPLPRPRGRPRTATWRYRVLDRNGGELTSGPLTELEHVHAPLAGAYERTVHRDDGRHVARRGPVHFVVRVPTASSEHIEIHRRVGSYRAEANAGDSASARRLAVATRPRR